jgi:hypothetical protein
MDSAEKRLQGLSLLAIISLAVVSMSVIIENNSREPIIIYVESATDDSSSQSQQNSNNSTQSAAAPGERQYNRTEVARIATFNIQIFGKTKMGKPAVVNELVEIFERYDMVVVQEIKDIDEQVGPEFLEALNYGSSIANESSNETNSNNSTSSNSSTTNESNQSNLEVDEWLMTISPRSGIQDDDSDSAEQYAFYYRRSVFRQLGSSSLYDDSSNDSFQREPFTARFELLSMDGSSSGSDFVLVTIHTSPAIAVDEMRALGDVADWAVERHSDNDVIILGDFNADCSYASYNELITLSIKAHPFTWLVPDNADTTVGDSRCAYDRIVANSDVDGRLNGNWGIDEEISNKSVSDHRPVWFDLIRADD